MHPLHARLIPGPPLLLPQLQAYWVLRHPQQKHSSSDPLYHPLLRLLHCQGHHQLSLGHCLSRKVEGGQPPLVKESQAGSSSQVGDCDSCQLVSSPFRGCLLRFLAPP